MCPKSHRDIPHLHGPPLKGPFRESESWPVQFIALVQLINTLWLDEDLYRQACPRSAVG